MATWVEFRYRDFYDVPRLIVIRYQGRTYLLDCPFEETTSEYGDTYEVFLLNDVSTEALQGSWDNLRTLAQKRIGAVRVAAVRFDRTRRREVDADSVPPLVSAT